MPLRQACLQQQPRRESVDASQQPTSQSTCGDDDPPLVGGHVGRRGAILFVYVAVVVHGVGLASTNQLAAFANTAVHRRLPRARREKARRKSSLPLPSAQHGGSPQPTAQTTGESHPRAPTLV